MDKLKIMLVIVSVTILCSCLAFAEYNSSDNVNNMTLSVYSDGSMELSQLINEIETKEYYAGYDNETLVWMESLGNKCVWFSGDEIIIMDYGDSNKIPSVSVCDGYGLEFFSCNVLENHSLGNGNNSKDVLLVNNFEYIGEEIRGNGLA